MIVINQDIWKYAEENAVDFLCFPTNGFVKRGGENVMGAGLAKQVSNRFPEIPKLLGSYLQGKGEKGNVPYVVRYPDDKANYNIITFPVKPCVVHDRSLLLTRFQHGVNPPPYPGYQSKGVSAIISRSAYLLRKYVDESKVEKVILPAVGCSSGGLLFKDVEPLLDQFLNDSRFLIVDINKEIFNKK